MLFKHSKISFKIVRIFIYRLFKPHLQLQNPEPTLFTRNQTRKHNRTPYLQIQFPKIEPKHSALFAVPVQTVIIIKHIKSYILLLLYWQKQLKLRRQVFLRIQPIREINPPNSAIRMNLDPQSLYIVSTIRSPCKVR